jgi:M6 family metalloprotease-like protein
MASEIGDVDQNRDPDFQATAGKVKDMFAAANNANNEGGGLSLRDDASDAGIRKRDINDIINANAIEADNTLNILVVLIQWTNHENRALVDPSDIEEMWNGVGIGDNYLGGSIANWTAVNSHGSWKTHATVTDWIMADNTERYYAAGDCGMPGGEGPSFDDAVEYIMNELEATNNNIDYSDFDSNNDGYLDSVMFVHSGYDAGEGGEDCDDASATKEHRIHSLARHGGDVDWSNLGHVLGNYAVDSAFLGTCGSTINRIGVPVHEFMHTIGLPDLYDLAGRYDPESSTVSGLGAYDIM